MNDIEIMKALFKAFSGGETICVELKDGSTQPGTISSFDGEKIMIAGQEIALAEIAGIGAPESMPVNVDGDDSERAHFSSDGISSLKLSRIGINYYCDTYSGSTQEWKVRCAGKAGNGIQAFHSDLRCFRRSDKELLRQ